MQAHTASMVSSACPSAAGALHQPVQQRNQAACILQPLHSAGAPLVKRHVCFIQQIGRFLCGGYKFRQAGVHHIRILPFFCPGVIVLPRLRHPAQSLSKTTEPHRLGISGKFLPPPGKLPQRVLKYLAIHC